MSKVILAGEPLARHPEDWQEIKFPSLAEPGDPLGREAGQALCLERYSEEELRKTKETMGTMMFFALYQQSPVPP